jgi:hypothetical protein
MNTYITELTTFGDFKSTPFSNVEYVSKFIAYKLFNIQNIYSCMQIKNTKDLTFMRSLYFTSGPTWARTKDHLIMSCSN